MSCLSVLLTELIGPAGEPVNLWHASCSLVLNNLTCECALYLRSRSSRTPLLVPFCLCF